ncbi:hypothetical protein [Leucobacter soli]|uniref:hypothetical protein n=1 Tax=Leucobacter soli TaxID=2812850 RepID=UPI003616D5BA
MPENPDAELLGDALGIPVERMALRSREPLGGGSVTGFGLAGDGAGDGGTGNGGTGDDGIPVEGAVEGAEESAELFYFVDTSRLPVERETGLTLGSPIARRSASGSTPLIRTFRRCPQSRSRSRWTR